MYHLHDNFFNERWPNNRLDRICSNRTPNWRSSASNAVCRRCFQQISGLEAEGFWHVTALKCCSCIACLLSSDVKTLETENAARTSKPACSDRSSYIISDKYRFLREARSCCCLGPPEWGTHGTNRAQHTSVNTSSGQCL